MGRIQEFIFQHTKECCRIIATTSLSLLFPISFLFIARYISLQYSHNFKLLTSTLFLTLFILIFNIAALMHGLTNARATFIVIKHRFVAWILLILIEVSLFYLWINQGNENAGIHDYATVKSTLFLPWRGMVLFVGLHETMVLWCRSVVARVVDEVVLGFYDDREDLKWMEKVVSGVVCWCMWWRWVGKDAEAMVDDVVGWWLYYLTAAIGVVKVVRSLVWLTIWLYRYMHLAYKRETLKISLLD